MAGIASGHGWQSARGSRAIVFLMKPQQLISAGFAITTLAAASVPALGWSLLGEFIDRPVETVQAPWSDAEPFFMAEAALVRVAMQQSPPNKQRDEADPVF